MDTLDIILMLIALALGTQLSRFMPLMLPKSLLARPILQKLNQMLPLVIMVLLVLTSLNIPSSPNGYALFFAQIIALLSVIVSYKWFNNILLSVGLGVLNVNVLLWVFDNLLSSLFQ